MGKFLADAAGCEDCCFCIKNLFTSCCGAGDFALALEEFDGSGVLVNFDVFFFANGANQGFFDSFSGVIADVVDSSF